MTLLDSEQAYVLVGGIENESKDKAEQDNGNGDPPKVLHLKLSVSVLDAILRGQSGDTSVRITSLENADAVSVLRMYQFQTVRLIEVSYTSVSAHQRRSAHASFHCRD